MKPPEYLLYRLNLVDRADLFEKPIRNNSDFVRVLLEAVQEHCDYWQQNRRSRWKWSLRDVVVGALDSGREYAIVTFSHETISKSGKVVGPSGITIGTSEINPPLAVTSQIVIDLSRHLVAIQDVSSIMQSRPAWKESLQTIVGQAANWEGFSSRISLTPIPPRQVVESSLRRFAKITRLRTTLRIPNPDLSPMFQALFEELSRGGVRELTEDMRSERGLNLEEGTLPRATLEMALGGYRKGHVRIDGYRGDGGKEEFTIADDVARVEGLREFVAGIEVGSSERAAKRVASAVLAKIDDMLPPWVR